GIHHVAAAAEAGAALEYLCYAPDLLRGQFARALVERLAGQGLPCLPTAPDVFRALAEKDNPQGILAVARQRPLTLEHLTPDTFPWGVALAGAQDPGNVGAVLRTLDAVGASGLLLLEGGADPYHPSAVRASMGALFWHPVVQTSFAEFAARAGRHGYHLCGASARGGDDYREVAAYRTPAILLMGGEREGLAPEQRAACERLIRLPMQGHVSSLNLAVATGVLLYDMAGKLTPPPASPPENGPG
ncbi:MAG: RNA methyltransferase, partial [Chloroflexi bacterium]|nr:RNA methyltransferase [Chloroflexota bacterium]